MWLLLRLARLVQISSSKRKRTSSLKLLITNRPTMDIISELNKFPCIDSKANCNDLRLVIDSKVAILDNLSSELQNQASDLLLGGAGRTFLWVSIVLKQLKMMALPSLAKIKIAINKSLTDLDQLYQSVVDRIRQGTTEEQRLLAWVVYNRRLLMLEELEAALATQMDSTSLESTEEHRVDLA